MKTRLFSFLTLLALLTSFAGFAQDYAITTKGDTIKGDIRIYNFGSEKKIQVAGADRKKVTIPMFQLRSFQFENETYHPVKGPSGYTFMKLMKDGYLSLYAFQMPNQSTYDGLFLVKKDGESLEVPNLNFKRALKKFLDLCNETVSRVDDGTYARKDVELIVDNFNDCIRKKSDQRTVVVSQPSVPVIVEKPVPATSEAWKTLEEKVAGLDAFSEKQDALDMIREIKNKLSRVERVPNFLVEGLKASLNDRGVDPELEAALAEIK